MNEAKNEAPAPAAGSSDIRRFAIKGGIVMLLILTLANAILPDFDKLKRFDTPKNKLYLLGFVQNPRALLKISEIEEDEGKLDNAIRDMELAVGLLEMHGVGKAVLDPYLDRIGKLKLRLAQTPPNKARP